MLSRRRQVALVVTTVLAWVSVASSALGAMRSGGVQYPAPVEPPSLSPQPLQTERAAFLKGLDVQYDPDAGLLDADFEFYSPESWATGPPGLKLSIGTSRDEPVLEAHFGFYQPPQDERPTPAEQSSYLTRRGYAGSVPGVATTNGAGYHLTYQGAGLAGLDLRCVSISGVNVAGAGDARFWFAGFQPVTLTRTNATDQFDLLLQERYGDEFTAAGHAWSLCPRQEFFEAGVAEDENGPTAICEAEFGSGDRRRRVWASMTQGVLGPEWQSTPWSYSFTRRWRRNASSCLRGIARGTAWSNDGACYSLPIGDIAYSLEHGAAPTRVYRHGTNTAGFDTSAVYRCRRTKSYIQCRNRLGDGFRYHPAGSR